MEQLYAPPGHAVFTLVPPTFHERATELYLSIGEPEVTVKSFWDIYRTLLGRLRDTNLHRLDGWESLSKFFSGQKGQFSSARHPKAKILSGQ
jgi:hypothetical protein